MRKATTFSLNAEFFKKALPAQAGAEHSKILYFPGPGGELQAFRVYESPVLSAQLAQKFPDIRSFTGRGVTQPESRIRFSLSHRGIQTMLVGKGGEKTTFMHKAPGSSDKYILYQRDDFGEAADFICLTGGRSPKELGAATFKLVDDQMLRKYRIAISATAEYTQFHGGTVQDALAAINASLTRINEVFETDLGITLELVANNDEVIFTDPASDPYGNNLNTEVQNTLSTTIGEENYDLGHLFHRANDSGNAGFIGSVCKDNQKGSAFSAAQVPEGDVFDLDFAAHEMGHQFGANHTWSFEPEGTNMQVEPGSGTTIMGYAGIVDGDNVQQNGDDYFHYISILQITEYLETVSCGEAMDIANNPPLIIPTGDFVIPKGTAFVLSAVATDPDAPDILTYAWEQIDDGVVAAGNFGPTNATGANFRSLPPVASAIRYFPRLAEVVQGNLTQTEPVLNSAWETVSLVERDLNFALTVRDNAPGGGQVASDLVKIQVLNSAGPFQVTSQAAGETYVAGSVQSVNWDVAGTSIGAVNAQQVDIFLSLDGGLSFPVQLTDATPNDGSAEILFPGLASSTARIMVKADDNVFFAVNSTDFAITESEVVLQFPALDFSVCQGDNLVIPFSYETYAGFSEQVTFSATGVPGSLGVSFSPPAANVSTDPVMLTITNTDQVPAGIYDLVVTATAASFSKQLILQLELLDGTFNPVVLNTPANGATDISLNTLLEWTGDENYDSYDVEIATDPGFSTIVESANVLFSNYKPSSLLQATTYYWRVKPINICGEGSFGNVFIFSTIVINCQSREAADLPIPISSVGTPVIESILVFPDNLPVADVNVTVDLEHTFLGDLVITLISPEGTEVVLTSNSCGEFENLSAVFDDEAIPFVCSSNPAISGTVKPLGSLATFDGESAFGQWTLRISDTAPADGGALNGFGLEICVEGSFRPDADSDGIFDDGDDLCLGTPPGTEVNPEGCPVFRFDPENFLVALDSENCIPSDNGAIEVTANQVMDYTISVSGPGINEQDMFTAQYQLGNLAAGTYSICIGGNDGTNDFELYCFEANIQQPAPLSVATSLTADGSQAILQLGGAQRYSVELNGLLQEVASAEVILNLKEGENSLKVYTDLMCQGSYSENIYVPVRPVFYPNPFDHELSVLVGQQESEFEISVYNFSGRLLDHSRRAAVTGAILLDFSGRAPGIYIIRLESPGINGIYKVVKR
jgi:subtilisin-like proprotein convertase family protein